MYLVGCEGPRRKTRLGSPQLKTSEERRGASPTSLGNGRPCGAGIGYFSSPKKDLFWPAYQGPRPATPNSQHRNSNNDKYQQQPRMVPPGPFFRRVPSDSRRPKQGPSEHGMNLWELAVLLSGPTVSVQQRVGTLVAGCQLRCCERRPAVASMSAKVRSFVVERMVSR